MTYIKSNLVFIGYPIARFSNTSFSIKDILLNVAVTVIVWLARKWTRQGGGVRDDRNSRFLWLVSAELMNNVSRDIGEKDKRSKGEAEEMHLEKSSSRKESDRKLKACG